MLWVKRDVAGAIEQHCDHVPCFNSRQRCPDTVVNSPSEGHVATRDASIQIHLIGILELSLVTISRRPEEQNRGASGYIDAPKRGIRRNSSHHVAKRGL